MKSCLLLLLDLAPIFLSLKLALITTVLLFGIGLPLAYWLSVSRSRLKPIFEALVSLPLVLPPTVLGFYLLLAFSPNNAIGQLLESAFGLQFVFSFEGLVVASVIYSLPFMVNPLYSGLSTLPDSLKEAAFVLGYSPIQTLFKVLLPNIKPALITAGVFSFAHVIGEFGVVLMIGGNLPNETQVASIAIYDQVEALNYQSAHTYSLILLGLSFLILVIAYSVNRKFEKPSML